MANMTDLEPNLDRYSTHPRDIFICCDTKTIAYAQLIAARLERELGWTCWYGARNIPPNCENTTDIILEMVGKCSVFLLLSSDGARHGKCIQVATSHAMAMGKPRLEHNIEIKPNVQPPAHAQHPIQVQYPHHIHDNRQIGIYPHATDKSLNTLCLKLGHLLSKTNTTTNSETEHNNEDAETPVSNNRGSFIYIFILMIGVLGGVLTFNSLMTHFGFSTIVAESPEEPEEAPNLLLAYRAMQGDINAQYEYGRLLMIVQDFDHAIYWLTRAAEGGHQSAQLFIGASYRDGHIVGQNYEAALYWFHRAGALHDAEIQYDTGIRYQFGVQLPQDYEQAAYWFRQAAEQNHSGAQVNLGWLYEFGHGVIQDLEQAAFWYHRAAALGERTGQTNLGVMLHSGRGVQQDYEQAAYWFRQAASQYCPRGASHLGLMYELGTGVEQNDQYAIFWYLRAAEDAPEPWVAQRLEQLLARYNEAP